MASWKLELGELEAATGQVESGQLRQASWNRGDLRDELEPARRGKLEILASWKFPTSWKLTFDFF